ncbi:uncharacterized protein DS421_13g395230 [Arachis hypogaea]|nr:uncharacterized protein DS421_13g395230 [Arachis hypogaea]
MTTKEHKIKEHHRRRRKDRLHDGAPPRSRERQCATGLGREAGIDASLGLKSNISGAQVDFSYDMC